jgi:hypothetical protein
MQGCGKSHVKELGEIIISKSHTGQETVSVLTAQGRKLHKSLSRALNSCKT